MLTESLYPGTSRLGRSAIEEIFKAIAPTPRISHLGPGQTAAPQTLLDAQEYREWNQLLGPQILYIQGWDYTTTHGLADYIMLTGKSKLPEDHADKFTRCRSFSFDS